jgi:hypothetical protein
MNELETVKKEDGYALIYEKIKKGCHSIEIVEVKSGLSRSIQCKTKKMALEYTKESITEKVYKENKL